MRIKKSKAAEVAAFNAQVQAEPPKRESSKAETKARHEARVQAAKQQAEDWRGVQSLRAEAAVQAEKCRPRIEGYFAALRSELVIPEEVLTLFKAPFVHDGYDYVRDADSETTASFSPVVPRGWGRIQYLENGEARFDEWVRVFNAVVGGQPCAQGHDEVARRLTEHWFAAATRLAAKKLQVGDAMEGVVFWETMFHLLDGPRLSTETVVVDVVSASAVRRYDVEIAKFIGATERPRPQSIRFTTRGMKA